MAVGLSMGLDLLKFRKRRFVRHVVVATFLTALIFLMIVLNASFNSVFRELQGSVLQGPLVLDKNGIHYLEPGQQWVINGTSLPINEEVLRKVLAPLRDAYLIINTVIASLIFVTQAVECYRDAKRDNEEFAEVMGTMYAFKARPGWIYSAFILNGVLSHAIGLVAGVTLAWFVLLPALMSFINETPAAPFFQNLDPMYGILAAAVFIMLNLSIRSKVLSRATTESALMSAFSPMD